MTFDKCIENKHFKNNNFNHFSNKRSVFLYLVKNYIQTTYQKYSQNYFQFKTKLIWQNIISILILHLLFIHSLFAFPYFTCWRTSCFAIFYGHLCGIGVTAGAHRYFTHRAYKAKLPLRIILIIAFYCSGQNSIYDWVRDHRVHHKYTETDADPHNSERGFFFSHVGWLMMKKHSDVIEAGRKIDMSDILNDPVIAKAERYFLPLKLVFAFFIPIAIPILFWNESLYYATISQIVRYTITLNGTWSVNSAAHLWGTKPYDKTIKPVENVWVSIATDGEGWHNYHHVFPWDYKAAEFGNYKLNLTTAVIDAFSKIGWAYDLKEPSRQLIDNIISKKANRSHKRCNQIHSLAE